MTTMAWTAEELKKKEAELDALALEIYAASTREIWFPFPLVAVRVLTKEQMRNGIVMPGTDQNKPLHEGIVLATWDRKVFEQSKIMEDGTRYTEQRVLHSQFKPGDHVLFPHWTGAPLGGLDEHRYRVVKEWEWKFEKDGGIYGIINHLVPDDTPRGILTDIVKDVFHEQINDEMLIALGHCIEDRLLLIDRNKPSVTLSGR
jgi:co-chaperonin GroES (HSP10)